MTAAILRLLCRFHPDGHDVWLVAPGLTRCCKCGTEWRP